VVITSKGEGSGRVSDAHIAPWDLDQLSAELLQATYRDLERFVAWLRSVGVEVPACWYVHPWSVHRLAAVMHWHRELGGRAREAAEWWASSWGLLRDRPEPTPSLDEAIARHCEEARRRPG
jgi:hypothetical protein